MRSLSSDVTAQPTPMGQPYRPAGLAAGDECMDRVPSLGPRHPSQPQRAHTCPPHPHQAGDRWAGLNPGPQRLPEPWGRTALGPGPVAKALGDVGRGLSTEVRAGRPRGAPPLGQRPEPSASPWQSVLLTGEKELRDL